MPISDLYKEVCRQGVIVRIHALSKNTGLLDLMVVTEVMASSSTSHGQMFTIFSCRFKL